MGILATLVFILGNVALFTFFGIAIYGDLEDFLAALVEWVRRLFSPLHLLFGEVVPGLRLLAWMMCVYFVLLGEISLAVPGAH